MRIVKKALFSLLLLSVAGCCVREHAVAERVVQSNVHANIRHDSIYVMDSIVLKENTDTVFLTKFRTLYREKLLRDTVVKCDTVFCERVVTVEKKNGVSPFRWLFFLSLFILFLWWLGVLRLKLPWSRNG